MLEPTSENETGFIVAWHSKRKHEAGKLADRVMTYGEAEREAEKLQQQDPENVYWAEHVFERPAPH